MRIKIFAATAIVAAVLMILSVAAWADSCGNVSRAAPACANTTEGCTTPVIRGNWAWLPSIEGPNAPAIWGFAPPGAPDSVNFQLPGANGNYQNTAVTGNQSLLDNSANCPPGTNTARQTTNGIQSGCL